MNRRAVRWLLEELPGLVRGGVLTPEAADRLRQHYGAAAGPSGRRIALTVCSILGAALVGAGVILLLAHNWEELPRSARTVIALAPLAAAQALALWTLAAGRSSAGWREGAATFLTLAIAAAIALVAQTYNIPGDSGTFTLTWMLLTLPVAYLLNATVPLLVYLIGITVWAGHALGDLEALAYWPLLALALPRLVREWRRDPFAMPAVLPGWTLCLCLLFGLGFTLVEALDELWMISYSALAAVLFAIGYLRFRDAPTPGQNPWLAVGGLGIPIVSLALTFEEPWRYLGTTVWSAAARGAPLWLGGLLLAVLTAAAVLALVALGRARRPAPFLFGLLPPLAVLGCVLRWLTSAQLPAMLLFNVYLFALGLGVLIHGIRRNRLGTVNLGMLFITALIVARFFDTDIGFLARGIAFIAVGLGFLATNAVLVRRAKGGAQ